MRSSESINRKWNRLGKLIPHSLLERSMTTSVQVKSTGAIKVRAAGEDRIAILAKADWLVSWLLVAACAQGDACRGDPRSPSEWKQGEDSVGRPAGLRGSETAH